MTWLYAALLGYLVGSIPFGLLLSFAAGKGDIRKIGSGNIGATNVLRTG
ncbi:MAG TPA: glycerol-3-phosphate acyltransferase, partial [Croceibacterium sp.]|nr:glycerol-3-phosphate acyltransferase [Croceibacterium sp.]